MEKTYKRVPFVLNEQTYIGTNYSNLQKKMNTECLLTYGSPILQNPNKIYTLLVDTDIPKSKWYKLLWEAICRFANKAQKKIKNTITNVYGLCEYCRIRLLIRIKGEDYVRDKLAKEIDEQITKQITKNIKFDFKFVTKQDNRTP